MEKIKKEHILSAIQEIDEQGIRTGRHSSTYDLVYDGKGYPPLLVLSIANRFATGTELPSNSLEGGPETDAFKLLQKEGFTIIKKPMNKERYDLKESFLNEWPLSRVQKMTLEEYTNLDKTSFCYWVEALTEKLGSIWGGSAYKFGIYKRKDTLTPVTQESKVTDGEYAWSQKYGATKDLAFRNIKNIIVNIIESSQNDILENIDSIDLGEAYKWKIAFLYGNFNVVDIYNHESLIEAALYLGYKNSNKSYSILNRYILSKKESNQDYFEFTDKLWKITTLATKKKYWLYAPGENANKWKEFYDEGIIALGWDNLGDLEQYPTKKQIKEKLQLLDGVTTTKQNDSTANHEFCRVIKTGDVIIVKKGIHELLGYGEVSSDYFYDENRDFYKSCRKVDWKVSGSWKVDFNLPVKTLTDITRFESEDEAYAKYYDQLLGIMDGRRIIINTEDTQDSDIYKGPLNQILYGPPGTGKTYHTINRSLSIIENKSTEILKKEDRKELKKRYNKYIIDGNIVFTTFHQSMSYEDFIEGIKPETTKEGNVIYKIHDGIFKQCCNDNQIFKIGDTIGNFKIVDKTNAEIHFKKPNGGILIVSISLINQLVEYIIDNKIENFETISEVDRTKYPLLEPFYINGYNLYPKLVKYIIDKKTTKNNTPKVLIIDEINRGNVSQIFGELITLIEEDKRLGNDESLEVTLPYSKEKFGVPPNLYIIGTMNTADRSVEALDTALRRRFSFEEMPPRSKVVEEKAFGDYPRVAVMEKINNRIELLLDRNHTLGHAYFIKENFKNSFENEIIPLLQEYFYNDYGKIGLVLGKGFVRDNSITKLNVQSIFADFETQNEVDIVKSYELIPFAEVEFETALKTLLV